MKTEYKDVLVKRAVYIADDGKEFMDEDECEEYEVKLLEESLHFYDADFEKTDFDSCVYVNLVTEDDVERLKRLCNNRYWRMPDNGLNKPGIYMFDNCSYTGDSWVNLDEVIFHIRGGVGK